MKGDVDDFITEMRVLSGLMTKLPKNSAVNDLNALKLDSPMLDEPSIMTPRSTSFSHDPGFGKGKRIYIY